MSSFVLLSIFLIFDESNSMATSGDDTNIMEWDYNDDGNNVSHWNETWPECGGKHQSPINVNYNTSKHSCSTPLTLEYSADKQQHFAIRNNGKSIQAIPLQISTNGGTEVSGLEILHHTNDTAIRLQNPFFNTYASNINMEYCFDSLHFHWGETNEYGSEHSLNGLDYPLELHLVHYSCDYYSLLTAAKAYEKNDKGFDDNNVLAVIGIFFEIGEANVALDLILNDMIMEGIHSYNKEGRPNTNLLSFYYTEFNLKDLIPQKQEFIGYKGSLTTPPCFETVRWLVMTETMTVSLEQMMKFRMILESTDLTDNMAPNWRPLQPINDRVMYDCQSVIDQANVDKIDDGHDNGHDDIHDFVEGNVENFLWVAIGILMVITIYLCYTANFRNKHEDDKHKMEENMSSIGAEDEESAIIHDSV